MKIVVLERNSVGTDVSVDCYKDFGEVTCYRNTVAADAAEKVKDADIIIANKCPMNENTLKDAPKVKLICEFATGFDNVDLEYCKKRGIRVANVRDYCTGAVAQHTFSLALYLIEHIRHYDDYVKGGEYSAQDRFSNFDLPYADLEGKIWGIIGMGNIGRRVAKIAEAFGCKVLFHSVTGKSTCTEYEQVSFRELLERSDVLSLHCPLSDLTTNLMDKEAFSLMKPTAVLINVARGPVVNGADLYEALIQGQIAAAGLDVLEEEPISVTHPLYQIKDSNKLIITPHMAWASIEARTRVVEEVYRNIEAFLNGESRNTVI